MHTRHQNPYSFTIKEITKIMARMANWQPVGPYIFFKELHWSLLISSVLISSVYQNLKSNSGFGLNIKASSSWMMFHFPLSFNLHYMNTFLFWKIWISCQHLKNCEMLQKILTFQPLLNYQTLWQHWLPPFAEPHGLHLLESLWFHGVFLTQWPSTSCHSW